MLHFGKKTKTNNQKPKTNNQKPKNNKKSIITYRKTQTIKKGSEYFLFYGKTK